MVELSVLIASDVHATKILLLILYCRCYIFVWMNEKSSEYHHKCKLAMYCWDFGINPGIFRHSDANGKSQKYDGNSRDWEIPKHLLPIQVLHGNFSYIQTVFNMINYMIGM